MSASRFFSSPLFAAMHKRQKMQDALTDDARCTIPGAEHVVSALT